MKIITNFIKTFMENIRDWKILILVIVFAPCFVYMMNMYLGGSGNRTYTVAVLNLDRDGIFSGELISEWGKIKTDDGAGILKVIPAGDKESAKKMIMDKTADIFITIPEDFSASFREYINTGRGLISTLANYGDQANLKYAMAAAFTDYTAFTYISLKTGIVIPINITFESAGNKKKLNEFDLYVPALLVLSVIMLLFSAGASIIREVEKETITRLSLSKLSSFEFMTGLSINQTIIGIASLFLTLAAAMSVGYRTDGSLALFLLIGIITCFSVISISIITTCFIKNMFGLLTVGCFPFFILMFFSDCFMPLPKIDLVQFFGHQLYLNDILPTATATRALNKVMSFNAGFSDISFELAWMTLLSIVYFTIGVLLFKRKYKY